jgi:high potential iron-sulfur protein
MSTSTRRQFVVQIVAAGAAIGSLDARAQGAGPKLSESDPQAVALGYKDDSAKVDGAKYPKHAPTQICANCQLFQGKASDATGGCALFPGKQVAAAGWCSAWNKRAS